MAKPGSSTDGLVPRRSYFRPKRSDETLQSSKPILVLEEVYKYFRRDVPTLRNVNLTVERGEFVFVTGPSGSGKSTLLQLVYRQHTVDSGRILFSGRDISRLTDKSIPFLRRNLGIVFQDFKVVPHWTVFENVAVALEILGTSARLLRSRVAETLERVGLAGRGNERTETLSGGEQQRVALARAIVTEPALILADEPTGNLDPQLAIDMLTLFEEIHETGTTVLFATHDHSLLQSAPHRLVVIDDGRLIEASHGLRAWSARTQNANAPAAETGEQNGPTGYGVARAARSAR
jgi:cell division transport system ATP-binding protein